MFDDLDKKDSSAETNSVEQNDNLQPQAETTPTPTAPSPEQPNKVEDIFSETEKSEVFKPKQTPTNALNNLPLEEKNSSLKKIIILIVVVVCLILFVWAMFLVFKFINQSLGEKDNKSLINQEATSPIEDVVDRQDQQVINNNLDIIDEVGSADEDANNLDNQTEIQPEIQPIDSDQDGLSDDEEFLLGTDINSVDTDIDNLFDREEVEVYKTNPLNADTDGDGYLDGDEVKNGYNPNGEGKLYEINTSSDISDINL